MKARMRAHHFNGRTRHECLLFPSSLGRCSCAVPGDAEFDSVTSRGARGEVDLVGAESVSAKGGCCPPCVAFAEGRGHAGLFSSAVVACVDAASTGSVPVTSADAEVAGVGLLLGQRKTIPGADSTSLDSPRLDRTRNFSIS
ncbi:hypothetical protein PF004_g7306 [Phytophthora fragariae]|uniref:Uncharacterized protein n=1 Tax=Phytophthora fragariae TaxID=53985 RepID=A0A6G0RQ91_9STRA|nr:hypothetical protein PF004_g7306 [Phytophthora fragariae]KAE9338948.1 hypothetical protein PF008_g11800 [Phytophthora fragariae]